MEALDARPSLRISYAQVLLASGRTVGFEEMLAAAEATLHMREGEERRRDLLCEIARLRAILAFLEHRADDMLVESKRALELLPSDNVTRAFVVWASGYAHEVLGERAEARKAYGGALSMSRATGYRFGEMAAAIGIAGMQEIDNELRLAAETYEDAIRLAADLPYSWISDAHLGCSQAASRPFHSQRMRPSAGFGEEGGLSRELGAHPPPRVRPRAAARPRGRRLPR